MERTPVSTLKASVSCESIDVPEYQPLIDRRPAMSRKGDAWSDSGAQRIISVPLTPSPPSTALMAGPLVTGARMTLSPPARRNAADGAPALLSTQRQA